MAWSSAENTGSSKEATKSSGVLSVSQAIKKLNTGLKNLGTLVLHGEISGNPHPNAKGNWYINLKEDVYSPWYKKNVLNTLSVFIAADVMDANPVTLAEGDEVQVTGEFVYFAGVGSFVFKALKIEASGKGQLVAQIKALEAKLTAEGLFARPRKKLPEFPSTVAVVTSLAAGSKAATDVTAHLNPLVKVLLVDSRVEGADAAQSIVDAMQIAESYKPDLIIVTRGGGESGLLGAMRAYNSELVLRKVAACSVPVLSAVGHTMDICLCDKMADAAADVPTDAGYKACKRLDTVTSELDNTTQRLENYMQSYMHNLTRELDSLSKRAALQSPEQLIKRRSAELNNLRQSLNTQFRVFLDKNSVTVAHSSDKLKSGIARYIQNARFTLNSQHTSLAKAGSQLTAPYTASFEAVVGKLHTLDPMAILSRGYAVSTDASGQPIKDASTLVVGQQINVRLGSGNFDAEVLKTYASND